MQKSPINVLGCLELEKFVLSVLNCTKLHTNFFDFSCQLFDFSLQPFQMTSHFNTYKNFVLCYAAKISAKKCCTFFKLPFNYKSELVSICMALSYRIYDPSYLQFIMVHPQLYMGICIRCYDNSFPKNSVKSDFLSKAAAQQMFIVISHNYFSNIAAKQFDYTYQLTFEAPCSSSVRIL